MLLKLTKKDYLRIYTCMLEIRRFEERVAQLYGMGHIGGFCHLYIGQEAVVVGVLMTIELLMRGLIETPLVEWEKVSYVARVILWWPAALSDADAFLSVTQSEVAAKTITYFGQSFELDPHFRLKPLISTLVSSSLARSTTNPLKPMALILLSPLKINSI